MVYCQKCGTENPDDAQFCSKCGTSLILTTAGQPQAREQKKNNSKRILLILLILFWPAGIIYYIVKIDEIRQVEEQNWFLNHPFITGLVIIPIVLVFIIILISFFHGVTEGLKGLGG